MNDRPSPPIDCLISPRRRLLLQGMGAAVLAAGCGDGAPRATPALAFGGSTMGSTYSVRIAGAALVPGAEQAVRTAVAAALDGVVARMSTYRDDSEVVRLNRHRDAAPIALSADTFAVLALAQAVSEASEGAFDVTVAPVVDAWGFGPGHVRRVVPEAELDGLRPQVGWRRLALDPRTSSATKSDAGVAVDLSGIAKGYGVDLASRALDALGVSDYMVEAGGEIRTRGRNAEGMPWQIAIERPDAMPQRAQRIVPLSNLALATSGDYRIYFERDGTRYCHEMDPATGRPIRHALASVSVVAPTCGEADAWATALIVLGPARGLALAERRQMAAHFIVREADGLREFSSTAFAALGARGAA